MEDFEESDILSDVLRSLRATGTVYFCDQLKAPWVKEYPGDDVASFHQVRRGGCWLVSDGIKQYLGPGDLVFIEPGRPHVLTDRPQGIDVSAENPDTLLLCGYCQFDDRLALPLASLFPVVSVIHDEQMQSHGWLRTLLDTLSAEYLSSRPGTQLVVAKLTEVLLVELIRINFGSGQDTPLLRALADSHIAKSLQLLHKYPEKPWSLDSLAAEVGLSRAGFAKRFKSLVEYSMFDYLTKVRLQLACELLIDTELSLYQVANRVGYESDLAFTRTFKKRLGLTPTAYRKAHLSNTNPL